VIVDLLSQIDTYDLEEGEEIIEWIKQFCRIDNDFGEISRTIILTLLTEHVNMCPIGLARHYLLEMAEAKYVSEEPNEYNDMHLLLQAII